MQFTVRPFVESDINAIVDLSLLAWEPIFESFAKVLGPDIYPLLYPDWRKSQEEEVTKTCLENEDAHVIVAEVDGHVVGFLAYVLRMEHMTGEIYLLAVHPDHQNHEIGTALNHHALQAMKDSGMVKAEVSTGGDEGHAPARRSYEKAGFTALPLVRYYKVL